MDLSPSYVTRLANDSMTGKDQTDANTTLFSSYTVVSGR